MTQRLRLGGPVVRTFNFLSPVLDVVLPPACAARGAGDVVLNLSSEAREQIAALVLVPYCWHCGLSVGPYESHDRNHVCARCGTRDVGVNWIARVGTFSEPLVTLVHRLKFSRAWEMGPILAPFLYQALLRVSEATKTPVDLLVPVPLHWRRQMQRGFNQSDELAREVAALAGWRVAAVLRRTRATRAQARLDSPDQRRENLRGAFSCRREGPTLFGAWRPHPVAGKHVWLMDDVSTTGATLHAAASALRRLGRNSRPASINAAVVCVTDREERECNANGIHSD
jgi:ComF family protein